jgi:hypothetical protein
LEQEDTDRGNKKQEKRNHGITVIFARSGPLPSRLQAVDFTPVPGQWQQTGVLIHIVNGQLMVVMFEDDPRSSNTRRGYS